MIKRLFELIGGRSRNGESFEDAVIIHAVSSADGVPKEYEWVKRRFGRHGRDWKLRYQAVTEHQGRFYDLLAIRLADGSEKDIYFDITSFFRLSRSSGEKVDAETHKQSEEGLEDVMVVHATGADRIAKQYAALETRFGRRDRDWEVLSESTVVHGVRVYHVIEIQLADGSVKNIHFKVAGGTIDVRTPPGS